MAGAGWVAANGCCNPGIVHRGSVLSVNGALYDAQRFAIDWMRLDEQGRLVHGDLADVHNYSDYGADVLAVADGRVVSAVNNLNDQIPGRLPDPSTITVDTVDGNHVVLDLGGGRFAFYAQSSCLAPDGALPRTVRLCRAFLWRHFCPLYASTYPNEVVGIVLVDALSEKVRTGLTPERWKLYVNFGFTKPTPGLEKYKDIETLDVNASLDQMEKAASAEHLRPMPLFVLTQGQPFDLSPWQPLPADFPGALNKAWHTAQDALTRLAPNAKHKIATKSSHYIQAQEPQLVIDAIKQVVEAVRNPSTWTIAP